MLEVNWWSFFNHISFSSLLKHLPMHKLFSKLSIRPEQEADPLLRQYNRLRPREAILRGVVMHCPSDVICCDCPDKENHGDDCNEFSTETIDTGDNVPNTAYGQYITKHVADNDHDEASVAFVCFCRSSICDIVNVEVAPGATALEVRVRMSLVAPELNGADVLVTDPITVDVSIEDDILFDDYDTFGDVTIDGKPWMVTSPKVS